MEKELTFEEKYNNLKLQNEKLRTEIDYMNMIFDEYVITSTTDTKGMIINISKPFEEISGYSKEELIGKPHNIVRHEDVSSSIFAKLWETISNKKLWRGEIKNRKKDGGFYWVDSIVIPLFDSNQEIKGYRAIRIDITDKKKICDDYAHFFIEHEEDWKIK